MFQPDFVKLAEAFGMHGHPRHATRSQVESAIEAALAHPGAVADRLPGRGVRETAIPMVPPGASPVGDDRLAVR